MVAQLVSLEKQLLPTDAEVEASIRSVPRHYSRQFWTESLAWSTADGTAVANTTTETIVFPDVTIPANYMQDGRQLEQWAFGKYSTTGTPTMRFRTRWGGVAGTVLSDSGTVTSGSGVTNAIWFVYLRSTTRANGSSGSVFTMGFATIGSATASTVGSATGAPAIAMMSSAGITVPAAVTVDLTAATALSLTITWGTASASNTITGNNYYLDSPN